MIQRKELSSKSARKASTLPDFGLDLAKLTCVVQFEDTPLSLGQVEFFGLVKGFFAGPRFKSEGLFTALLARGGLISR